MFHLQHPANKHYMNRDELGCLSRAFGFTADLFKSCHSGNDVDIKCDENGLEVKSIFRILDLNLLYNDLHRTHNMHTADWNAHAISCAVHMLAHRVLDFDGVYQVRVAYMTYEDADMKGMLLEELTLLRALKLCGRVIAPLKLKHRIKHMKAHFQEPGRIQLDEFFILLLWCDLYTAYSHDDLETASGKEGGLFKLVDFRRLLSHHDERLANRLNAHFLREERDYGIEKLQPKVMFKDSTVNTELMKQQVPIHKENYQPLKIEVSQSQARVYNAHAGNVRPRPISFPDLYKYRQGEEFVKPTDMSVQSTFQSAHRRLHSAPPMYQHVDVCLDRPQMKDHVREQTPAAVTPRDVNDVRSKLENLLFDTSTLETRCQVQVENEMMFYIPGYLQKLANKRPDTVETPHQQPKKKRRHWTSQIIKGLVYPPSTLHPTDAKNCDARFRGWHQVNCNPGYNFVLTSQSSNISKRDKISQTRQSSASRLSVRPDYVIKYTPRIMSSKQGSRGGQDTDLNPTRN